MTSAEIRQSFLDFFKSKQHTIVPSSSLMPDAPNLLFTNAGMNQFVPIFLSQRKTDVSKWPGAVPGLDTRAADTQKCIRAGGKHNDLEDVGLDTYHHTFFEMLGNWSFGDYFKKEAIEWAWELVVGIWKFPPERLYATVYSPDKSKGDPSNFDQEAYDHWARIFSDAGLDPKVHIVHGNKKDNFWMMGDTGPCGPCSEIHVDLTPAGDTHGSLVNKGDARCIEIWNLVFIQFNANPDGTFSPLPAKHVDTGMGFERVASIIQGTKGFTDFANAKISNYETDVFRPIFDELERLSGKRYRSTLPGVTEAPAISGEHTRPRVSESAPSPIVLRSAVAAVGETPTATREGACGPPDQEEIDIAFRVIADHIRTLSFAIADGIQPGNNDRNYVLRRILRRAVRYGRTLGFHEPFFYKLVDVLADTMGHVFPEIREKRKHVQEVIRVEEEGFNKTLDRGLSLFDEEAANLLGSARGPRASVGGSPTEGTVELSDGARYSKRNLPHFEKPWAIYAIHFTTRERKPLLPVARRIVLDCILHWRDRRYQLFAACVMPDHVHFIIQPGIKEQDKNGDPIFYSLTEILHTIKSYTAHEINKLEHKEGPVWERESFDRFVRSDRDLQEKFHYICRNPWDSGVVALDDPYPFLWTPEVSRPAAATSTPAACAPQISGAFAFRLYDEQGFPLDLTELMARERGLTVDVEGFNKLMEEQRARARAAQKKQVIEISQVETTTPTCFIGYDKLETPAKVLEIVSVKDKTAVILDTSVCYAEMGGQVGDTGELSGGGQLWRVVNTQKSANTWLHFIEEETTRASRVADRALAVGAEPAHPSMSPSQILPTALEHPKGAVGEAPTAAREGACAPRTEPSTLPTPGNNVTLSVDHTRRFSIQRHHTVTHLFHWALHEVVSKDASQKGSYVGSEKLTFDFNSPPLTPRQIADIEKLVNERVVENAGVSWIEVPYTDVKSRKDVMQFFGDKYGDVVRVVQIGGKAGALNGYSMELCGGTHTRATGEIGLFLIVGESAIAAGVRRVEAVAGLTAYDVMKLDRELIKSVAGKVNSPVHELEKKIENLLEQQKALEKQLKATQQKEAANAARALLAKAQVIESQTARSQAQLRAIIENLGAADGDYLQAVADALKGQFQGVIVLGGVANNAVSLIAAVTPEFTAKVQAGKIIQQIAPIVGGRGGGKPDNARGGGKDASKLDEALAKAKSLL